MSRDDSNKDQAEWALRELQDRGSRGVWFQGDLTDEATQAQLFKFIKGEFGQLDALVNKCWRFSQKTF